jgi:hypothetical protein
MEKILNPLLALMPQADALQENNSRNANDAQVNITPPKVTWSNWLI